MKFFDARRPEDIRVRFFDSGWFSVDSLCYIFNLLPPGKDPNFVNGHRYFYRVRTKDFLNNQSEWSKIKSSIQDPFPPSDISNLSAAIPSNDSDGCIDLNWQSASDPVSGVAAYTIYRSPDGTTFSSIDTISGDQTSYCDFLSNFGNNGPFNYRIGSIDKVGNERLPGQSAWLVSIPVFFSPRIASASSQIFVCTLSGMLGTQNDTLTIMWDFLNNAAINGFEIEIDGPNGKVVKTVNDPNAVNFDCPLNAGDGLYKIRLLALYPDLQNTIYSNTVKIKKKTSVPSVQDLTATQDNDPTGNIILSWSEPDPSEEIVEFQVFSWAEGQQPPKEPTLTLPVDSLRWIQNFHAAALSAYRCNFYQVRTKDCFGLISGDNPIVSQYSNRPPQFDAEKTEIRGNNITVFWDRPLPGFGENAAFETVVVVYQDSITSQPFGSVVVFNETKYTLLSLQPMHNYIFKVRETILDDLGQSCSNSFFSAFSQPLTVPLDNLPPSVTFGTQALPVYPDSITGTAFVFWQRPDIPTIHSFLIKWS